MGSEMCIRDRGYTDFVFPKPGETKPSPKRSYSEYFEPFETPLLNHIALKQAIDQLPEEEAQLIKFRYMDNLSQAETAKRMGKNQVSVSRSERKILEKLRRKML